MKYAIRAQVGLVTGVLGAVLLLAVGIAAGDTEVYSDPLGIEGQFWALALVVLAVGLIGQLVINNRAAFRRERNLVRTAAQLREVSAELDRLAKTDALTGIQNRRAFFDILGVEFRRSRRYRRQLSVLMLDLDKFKSVNDRWGHQFGDYLLHETANLISMSIRESDILGRYGGEEFALALPETSEESALLVGEKLRAAVEAHEFRTHDIPPPSMGPIRLTLSIGVASLPVEDDQDEADLIRRADQALYEAKRLGRNRVLVYRPPEIAAGVEDEAEPDSAVQSDAS